VGGGVWGRVGGIVKWVCAVFCVGENWWNCEGGVCCVWESWWNCEGGVCCVLRGGELVEL
jgi:hypothetical protein